MFKTEQTRASFIFFLLLLNLQRIPVCFATESDESLGLDPISKEALANTQNLLKDPEERKKAISGDAKATWTNKQVESIGGSGENVQAIYELAADVFNDMTKEAKGDPQKMKELLLKAQEDPTSFANKFTPAEKAKLNGVSRRIPATNSQVSSPSVPQTNSNLTPN